MWLFRNSVHLEQYLSPQRLYLSLSVKNNIIYNVIENIYRRIIVNRRSSRSRAFNINNPFSDGSMRFSSDWEKIKSEVLGRLDRLGVDRPPISYPLGA